MTRPNVLILRTAGTNCDEETAHAFELVGATAKRVHLLRVLENPKLLDEFQILAIPGGFSYGDDISSGRIFASQLSHHLAEPLNRFVAAGKPVIGICNGFQVLIKMALLLGSDSADRISATLTHNDSGRFIDRWVHLKSVSRKCIWTSKLSSGAFQLPIAHGEGKFIPASSSVAQRLWENDQVALVYCTEDGSEAQGSPANPNGSFDNIAGICDSTGLVLGLMPHPERHVQHFQQPAWTKNNAEGAEVIGRSIFRAAVDYTS